MHANAAIGGRFGAPAYEGELTGQGVGVRNVLQGVDVRDGEFTIAAARRQRAHRDASPPAPARDSLSLLGDASLGASPRAELNLKLEQFQLLGRVDRRIVASGDATLKLGRDTLALNGDFKVDEGLIDFSRSEAPSPVRRRAGQARQRRGVQAGQRHGRPKPRPMPRAPGAPRSTCGCSWAKSCASAAWAWTPGCAASCA